MTLRTSPLITAAALDVALGAESLWSGAGRRRSTVRVLDVRWKLGGPPGAEEFAAEIKKMITDAVEMEEQYNHDLLPGGILGLNANYINQYVKYLADRRLEELGFDPEYKVTNPAKWMATANDTLQLVNFFESTNTSYESNASASSGKK